MDMDIETRKIGPNFSRHQKKKKKQSSWLFSTDKFDRSILCLVKVLSNNFGTELTYKEQFPLFLRDCNYRNCVKDRQVKVSRCILYGAFIKANERE